MASVDSTHTQRATESLDLSSYSELFGYFDPREWQSDPTYGWWYGSFTPPAFFNRDGRGASLPVYQNEQQLKLIRDRSRRLCVENEFAIGALGVRSSFVLGTGLVHKATPARKGAEGLAAEVQRVVDTFVAANDEAELQREALLRYDRDGEFFLRRFEQPNGLHLWRFVEPECVRSPGGDSGPGRSFGVECDPEDIATVLAYYVTERPWENHDPIVVEAGAVVHVRANVDSASKRGIPLFYPVESNLRRAEELLAAMTTTAKIRAKIALIRKIPTAPRSAAQSLVNSLTEVTTTDPLTGAVNNVERLRNGTILTASKDTEYEFPEVGGNSADCVVALQAELRAIAARLQMPEFMLSADASNANYSSTLVAESPAVKNFERLQQTFKSTFGECKAAGRQSLLWRQIAACVRLGILPPAVFRDVEIQTEAPSLIMRDYDKEAATNQTYVSMGVKSRHTVAAEIGLDYDQESAHLAAERGTAPAVVVPPPSNPAI